MQKFKYIAVDIDKKKFKGHFLAEDVESLRIELARQNLYLIKATAVSGKPPSAFFSMSGKVKIGELTTFCRQFAIMINSGVSIVDSLYILKDQSFSDFFKKVLSQVYDDVKVGLLLSEAMEKHPKVFPRFFTSMSYVGEQSGTLDQVLISCADYYENDAKIKSKTKSAMVYPLFLLIMMLAILVLMVLFVIPTFEGALSQIDVEMPALTKAIMDFSHWFSANWMYVFLAVILLAIIFVSIGKTKKGKYFYHTVVLKLPIFGNVQSALIASRFARGFGLLLSGGMDIVDAMKVIQRVLGNKNIEKRFAAATKDVSEGKALAVALSEYRIFPTMLIQMVSVGEKTGSIDNVLLRSSAYFDEQADRSLSTMTTLLQPIMLILMGGVIGVLFVAIYSPMLGIMTTL